MCIKFVSIDLFPVLSVVNMFILIVTPKTCFKQTGIHIDFKVLLLNFSMCSKLELESIFIVKKRVGY